jgi:hypothetical protein
MCAHLDVLVAQAAVGHAAGRIRDQVRLLVMRFSPVQPRPQVAEVQPHLQQQVFRYLGFGTLRFSPVQPRTQVAKVPPDLQRPCVQTC